MNKKLRKSLALVGLYLVATCLLLVMISPYLYMFLQSLAPWREVDRVFIPSSLELHSYKWLLGGG